MNTCGFVRLFFANVICPSTLCHIIRRRIPPYSTTRFSLLIIFKNQTLCHSPRSDRSPPSFSPSYHQSCHPRATFSTAIQLVLWHHPRPPSLAPPTSPPHPIACFLLRSRANALRLLRRQQPRVRHSGSQHAHVMGELPRDRRVLRHHLQQRRRLRFPPVGQEQAAHALSLQQRPDGPPRSVRLRARRLRRRLLVRDVATGRQTARSIQDHLRARPRLHALHQRISGHPHQQPLLRPHRREPRDLGSRGSKIRRTRRAICRSSRTPSGASGT